MQLTIQTDLNGCTVYVYNSNLQLVPVIIQNTYYIGNDQNDVLKRRYQVKAAPWADVVAFYLGKSIDYQLVQTVVTEENALTVLAPYLGYDDGLVDKTASVINYNTGWSTIDFTSRKEVDFGALTIISTPSDILKFIFNDVSRDVNGNIITVEDADDSLIRVKAIFSEEEWIQIFPLTQKEYLAIFQAYQENMQAHIAYMVDRFEYIQNCYNHTKEHGETDSQIDGFPPALSLPEPYIFVKDRGDGNWGVFVYEKNTKTWILLCSQDNTSGFKEEEEPIYIVDSSTAGVVYLCFSANAIRKIKRIVTANNQVTTMIAYGAWEDRASLSYMVDFMHPEQAYMVDSATEGTVYTCYTNSNPRKIKRIQTVGTTTTICIANGNWSNRTTLVYAPDHSNLSEPYLIDVFSSSITYLGIFNGTDTTIKIRKVQTTDTDATVTVATGTWENRQTLTYIAEEE